MVLRWAAAALLMTEQNFWKDYGCRDLRMLKAALDQKQASSKKGGVILNDSDPPEAGRFRLQGCRIQ